MKNVSFLGCYFNNITFIMKTIGIIWWMSYESSIHYYERVNKQVNELVGGLTCAKMIIYNVNFEGIRKLMINNERNEIWKELVRIAKILENAGADYIAIATNTMHKLADYVQHEINIPLIHIADCVAYKCNQKNVLKVWLLWTKYTMIEDFLTNKLEKNWLTVATPTEKKIIDEIDKIIFDELCKGMVKNISKEFFVDVINNMVKEKSIEWIILWCTEIEMLIKQQDLNIPIFDTTQSHIDIIVDYSLGKNPIYL